MSFKKGRLSAAEKEAISKSGDLASLKRVAKKLNRSLDTVQKYVDGLNVVEATETSEVIVVKPTSSPEVINAFGEKSTRESGVVVATAGTSGRVDSMNKKMKKGTVEQILESKPDCTARIR